MVGLLLEYRSAEEYVIELEVIRCRWTHVKGQNMIEWNKSSFLNYS